MTHDRDQEAPRMGISVRSAEALTVLITELRGARQRRLALKPPSPRPGPRWRTWALRTAAALAVATCSLPAMGAVLEFAGFHQAAETVRKAPAMAKALINPPDGFTRKETITAVDSGEPTLFVDIPTDEWLKGSVVGVPHRDVRVAAYLQIGIPDVEERGCHAWGYYGTKPKAGDMATIGIGGSWSLRWQSPREEGTTTCDHLASDIVVALFPASYTPPTLSDQHTPVLPDEIAKNALSVTRIVLREWQSERKPYLITTYHLMHPREWPR